MKPKILLLFAALLLWPLSAMAADGIQSGKAFKVPFAVDGKAVVNRAVVNGDVLTITFVKGDDIAVLSFKLVPQDDPFPNPNPDPQPDPNPQPDKECWGVVIEESSERTPAQAVILTSAKVRTLFDGSRFRVLDKDQQVGADLKPYIDRSAGKKLPLMYLVGKAGAVLYEGPLPADEAATIKLINEKKGVTP